ncbi:MAG: hypothetical protein FWC41_04320 [Firmicutes bacterium]|nr:hypothetical protein [Bacillota bacterium]
MAKKITASRISSGNQLFPASVILDKNGVTVKFPGFFNSQSNRLSYSDINGVTVDTPLVGFSTISFMVKGDKITAHGFTKSEAQTIKQVIEKRGL